MVPAKMCSVMAHPFLGAALPFSCSIASSSVVIAASVNVGGDCFVFVSSRVENCHLYDSVDSWI